MSKIYKVKVEGFELNGVALEVGHDVELTDEEAAPLVAEGKVELSDQAQDEDDSEDSATQE